MVRFIAASLIIQESFAILLNFVYHFSFSSYNQKQVAKEKRFQKHGGVKMIKRSIFYVAGMIIACTGVGLVIKSNIGAGPWDAFYAGTSEKIGLSIGTCVIIGQIVFLLINSLLLKKRPVFESAITIVLWGLILDFCMEFLLKNVYLANLSLLSRWLFFLAGVVFIGIGIGAYLTSRFPSMPYDGTMLAIVERFRLNMNFSRTILEGAGLLAAYFIGGPVGLGSVVFVFFLGAFIQICNRGAEKLLLKS